MFGTPNKVEFSSFYYSNSEFCEKSDFSQHLPFCSVRFSENNKVESWDDFKPEYTTDLDDNPEPVRKKKSKKISQNSSPQITNKYKWDLNFELNLIQECEGRLSAFTNKNINNDKTLEKLKTSDEFITYVDIACEYGMQYWQTQFTQDKAAQLNKNKKTQFYESLTVFFPELIRMCPIFKIESYSKNLDYIDLPSNELKRIQMWDLVSLQTVNVKKSQVKIAEESGRFIVKTTNSRPNIQYKICQLKRMRGEIVGGL
jgi:hypothetical protein